MARIDTRNKTSIWTKQDMAGVVMMRADFQTHTFTPHVHEDYVIAVTERGGAEYTNKGVSRYAEEDTILVFNPDEPHSGRMGDSERWMYRSFYINPKALETVLADVEDSASRRVYFTDSKIRNAGLARALLNAHCLSEMPGLTLAAEERFISAFATLVQQYADPSVRVRELGRERKVVSAVQDYLFEHFAEEVSLKDLAALSGISIFHLIRCFNRAVGLSPHAYLTQIRLRNARRLLIKGEPPAEVAAEVGFYDQSALTRYFKRAYGATPRQFAEAISAQWCARDLKIGRPAR